MTTINGRIPRPRAAAEPTPSMKWTWASEAGLQEGRDWYRMNPGARRSEYFTWATSSFIPRFLAGMGWTGERSPENVRALGPDLDLVVDELADGLAKAHELHERGRANAQ